jgi:hypothetical protein
MRRLLVALLLASAASCDTLSTDIRNNTVDGTWRGTVSGQTLTLNLQQSGQTLAGSGTLVTPGAPAQTRNMSVSGNYTKPSLTLTMLSGSDPNLTLTGTVEGDSFLGNLTGGTFAGAAIAMLRD